MLFSPFPSLSLSQIFFLMEWKRNKVIYVIARFSTFERYILLRSKWNLDRQDRRMFLSILKPDTNLDLSALDLGVEPVVRGEGDRQQSSGDYTGYGGKRQRHCGARHLGILSPISLFVLSFLSSSSNLRSLFFSRLFR